MSENLYKFRAIDKYAIDILMRRRLFLSDWENLNDPHEAKMLVTMPGINFHMNPKRLKEKGLLDDLPVTRVCSLAATWWSNLLWTHYAEEQRGIAIGIALPGELSDIQKIKIKYDDEIPQESLPLGRESIIRALGHKSSEWKYEEETRLVSFGNDRRYVEGVEITDVIFGLRASQTDIELVKELVKNSSIKLSQTCHKPGTYKLNRAEL